MPFQSKAQMGWMFANKPGMAKRWAAHTPDMDELPEKKRKRKMLADNLRRMASA